MGLPGNQRRRHSDVIDYLSKLGLSGDDLAKVSELMVVIDRQDSLKPVRHDFSSLEGLDPEALDPEFSGPETSQLEDHEQQLEEGLPLSAPEDLDEKPLEFQRDEFMRALLGEDLLSSALLSQPVGDTAHLSDRPVHKPQGALRLYVAEEQMVLKEAYRSYFTSHLSFDVSGLSSEVSVESIDVACAQNKPDLLLLGLKSVGDSAGDLLRRIQLAYPAMPLVLLFTMYDTFGIKALREFSNNTRVGYAYLLKHNVDTADQLGQTVLSVSQNRVIVDPEIMEELVEGADDESRMLTALSPKEIQVLSWMSRGFANDAIADVLFRKRKSVERQVSSIYNKLQLGDSGGDLRVGATLMYLRATGILPRG